MFNQLLQFIENEQLKITQSDNHEANEAKLEVLKGLLEVLNKEYEQNNL